MAFGDQPVAVSSQRTTYRRTPVVGGTGSSAPVTDAWNVDGLPRQFVNALQTVGGAAATLKVEWAIRDSTTPTVPEWLWLQSITLVPGVPVNTLLGVATSGGTGAVWLRFTLSGAAGDTCELAASAFV